MRKIAGRKNAIKAVLLAILAMAAIWFLLSWRSPAVTPKNEKGQKPGKEAQPEEIKDIKFFNIGVEKDLTDDK